MVKNKSSVDYQGKSKDKSFQKSKGFFEVNLSVIRSNREALNFKKARECRKYPEMYELGRSSQESLQLMSTPSSRKDIKFKKGFFSIYTLKYIH